MFTALVVYVMFGLTSIEIMGGHGRGGIKSLFSSIYKMGRPNFEEKRRVTKYSQGLFEQTKMSAKFVILVLNI